MLGSLRKVSIGTKITLIVLLVVLVSVTAVSFIAFEQSKRTIKERYIGQMEVIADLKVQKVSTFFSEIQSSIQIGQRLRAVRSRLEKAEQEVRPENNFVDFGDSLNFEEDFTEDFTQEDSLRKSPEDILSLFMESSEEFSNAIGTIESVYDLDNIYLLDKDGRIVDIARPSPQQKGNKFKEPAIDYNIIAQAKKDSIYFSKVFIQNNKPTLLVSAPVRQFNEERSFLGILIYEIDMSKIDALASDHTGLGESGEVLLLQIQESNKIKYLNSLRHNLGDKNEKIKQLKDAGVLGDVNTNYLVQKAVKGEQAIAESEDYRGAPTLAVSRFIPEVGWGVVVKIDLEEIYAPTNNLFNNFLIAGLVTIVFAFIIGFIFSLFLIRPLASLKNTISALGRGELPSRIETRSADEIGEMTQRINELVQNLYNTASFARRIGEKDFEAEFKPASDQDILGNALLTMRDSIINAAKADEERSWIVEGVAEVGKILRASNELSELGEGVLAFVVRKINAVQGAFYIARYPEEDEEGSQVQIIDEHVELEMTASYAYNKKKYLQAKFKFAEGLVGQAAAERQAIMRTEIPEDYLSITSGLLGENKPRCLLITPLITNERIFGVLELAGFETFGQREQKFIQEISEIIARTIFNITANERTRFLYERSNTLNAELQEQQKILNENAREMAITQEQLQKSNKDLEYQIQQVENEQRRTQILLENASEVITIYEADGIVKYVSPSVERILGYKAEEMVGVSDIEYIEQGRERFQKMFQDLLQYPDERITIEFTYRKKSGESVWLESTGNNLLNDPVIKGIVLNIRDITERKRAEKEERMRGQMQALSENSLDLIFRLDKEARVYYVNPTIKQYTGIDKEVYLQNLLNEEILPAPVIERFLQAIQAIERREVKQSYEIEFPSIMGNRNMSVNAIPEKNAENQVESILFVAHDITELKAKEEQLREIYKKVQDSINYAKRIQEAIMPETSILQRFFADSFILFRPKDVVSGDFPWLVEKDKDVYIAAVDCTGHGVPGALMSLIGYFLLNNIVDTHENLSASAILDLLDEQVTKTLRQDTPDSVTKDGMDISLAKINVEQQLLEYAGAHRPLYYLNAENGELDEIKGNKFPIGGAQYRNRTNFDNFSIQYKPGDIALLFSDGLPDQFGGPDNRKFSPKRIRDILKNSLNVPMTQVDISMNQELNEWMKGGEVKQTDDILVIGIRF
jgi:PAS domain S-box-containing protein